MTVPDRTAFAELVETMARLRAADGCPWDREQTHASLKPYLLEEAYEALEAIDKEDDAALCRELGDVLLQVVFHAQIARETARFSMEDVCRAIADKLVRRHPHIFGEVTVASAGEVVTNWERIKEEERREEDRPASALEGVPKHSPALLRAQRIQARASRVGFDWDHISGPLDKVEEEFAELREAVEKGETARIHEEFGDLLFALVNTGRFLELCPEDVLRRAVDKFEKRFRQVEAFFKEQGRDLRQASLEEMDQVWDQIKERGEE
jgi:tetrapyrrole methylase family protein/MazG family protein